VSPVGCIWPSLNRICSGSHGRWRTINDIIKITKTYTARGELVTQRIHTRYPRYIQYPKTIQSIYPRYIYIVPKDYTHSISSHTRWDIPWVTIVYSVGYNSIYRGELVTQRIHTRYPRYIHRTQRLFKVYTHGIYTVPKDYTHGISSNTRWDIPWVTILYSVGYNTIYRGELVTQRIHTRYPRYINGTQRLSKVYTHGICIVSKDYTHGISSNIRWDIPWVTILYSVGYNAIYRGGTCNPRYIRLPTAYPHGIILVPTAYHPRYITHGIPPRYIKCIQGISIPHGI